MDSCNSLISEDSKREEYLRMKIIIDVQLLTRGNYTGIAYYGYKLIEALVSKYKEDDIRLSWFDGGVKLEHEDLLRRLNSDKVLINHGTSRKYRILNLLLPVEYSKRFEDADITYFFGFFLPRRTGTKAIFTIHDMVFMSHPETVTKKGLLISKLEVKRSAKRANRIITVSEASKREILHYYHVPDEKIAIVPPAYDEKKFNTNYDLEEIKQCCEKYGISGEYILYVGTLEPRKNLVRLIEAYDKTFCNQPDPPQLVLAGMKGWKFDSIFEAAANSSLKDNILFTGYVEEKDVPILMNGATVFAFPSIYEGFGMPCLEAMACGTPVLTSNLSSMPEVVGEAGILVDPYSIDDIGLKLKELMANPQLREKHRELGLEQCKKFSWEDSARKLHKVFEEVVNQ